VAEADIQDLAPVSYNMPLSRESDVEPVDGDDIEAAWEEALLRENSLWFCRLRWIVVSLLILTGTAIWILGGRLTDWGIRLSPAWPLSAAVVLAVANLVYIRLIPSSQTTNNVLSERLKLWIQIVVDLIVLTVVIHCLGGAGTNAPFAYLFHVVLACIFFHPSESLAVTAVAASFYLGCLLLEAFHVIPHATVWFGQSGAGAGGMNIEYLILEVGETFGIWLIIWYLVSRLGANLRHHEAELAVTNVRLKASSDERMKHMLQTTHHLKAPFAAIHANAQLMLQSYCGELPDRAEKVTQKISDRCEMLSEQIQSMLQLANLRSESQARPPGVDLDLSEVIQKSVDRAMASANERGIRFETDLEPTMVCAAEDHMAMLVENIVNNSVSYSKDDGLVEISCAAGPDDSVVVMIRDHGIGIPPDKLPLIFDDYYRTDEAANHCRMSTGLGLAVVRDVAITESVEVQVESRPGWGTRFWLTMPTKPERIES
jgi:two-component system, OmpR family, phosphate regulon sensor histidine kinase PhoR